jgi:hypothetical protein
MGRVKVNRILGCVSVEDAQTTPSAVTDALQSLCRVQPIALPNINDTSVVNLPPAPKIAGNRNVKPLVLPMPANNFCYKLASI